VSDTLLLQMIKDKISDIVEKQRRRAAGDDCKTLIGELDALLRTGVTDAVKDYRANADDRIAYETSLGAFIIEQNPYAAWENIDFPNLPLDPQGENPWVRRSGVLRNNNALNPLPAKEAIPGGNTVNFSYVSAPELVDDGTFVNPPGDVLPDPKKPAPDHTEFYAHNVVKAVRLRYSVFDRRYGKSSEDATSFGRDKQTGYILILYSGNDI
jgi:hypothetical protein